MIFSKKNKFSPHTCEDSAAAARPSAEAKKKRGNSEWNRRFHWPLRWHEVVSNITAVNMKGPSRDPYFRGLNRKALRHSCTLAMVEGTEKHLDTHARLQWLKDSGMQDAPCGVRRQLTRLICDIHLTSTKSTSSILGWHLLLQIWNHRCCTQITSGSSYKLVLTLEAFTWVWHQLGACDDPGAQSCEICRTDLISVQGKADRLQV